jgi:hypothetical protein
MSPDLKKSPKPQFGCPLFSLISLLFAAVIAVGAYVLLVG